jgi:hypothetical protein
MPSWADTVPMRPCRATTRMFRDSGRDGAPTPPRRAFDAYGALTLGAVCVGGPSRPRPAPASGTNPRSTITPGIGQTTAHAELRVLGVVTVLWWVLPGPCFGAYGAAANSLRMAALSTTQPAKLEEAKNLSFCGCLRRSMGGPPGPPPSSYAARHCFGRSLSIYNGQQKAGTTPTPCHSEHIAHRGPCGKTRVVPQNCRPRPAPAEMTDSQVRVLLSM